MSDLWSVPDNNKVSCAPKAERTRTAFVLYVIIKLAPLSRNIRCREFLSFLLDPRTPRNVGYQPASYAALRCPSLFLFLIMHNEQPWPGPYNIVKEEKHLGRRLVNGVRSVPRECPSLLPWQRKTPTRISIRPRVEENPQLHGVFALSQQKQKYFLSFKDKKIAIASPEKKGHCEKRAAH